MHRIIDTSAIMEAPSIIIPRGDERVVIPSLVIKELDAIKEIPEKSPRAQAAIREILANIDNDQILFESRFHDMPQADDQIIALLGYGDYAAHGAVVITNDFALQLRVLLADQEYRPCLIDLPEVVEEEVDAEQINLLYKAGQCLPGAGYFPNQCVLLKNQANPSQTSLAMMSRDQISLRCVRPKQIWEIQPRSMRQQFLAALLMDPDIRIVTATGRAGTGKTFLSLAAALELVIGQRAHEKIYLTRPIVPVGRDLGYTKGTTEEKLDPWFGAIDMIIRDLVPRDSFQVAKSVVRLPLTYARGYTVTDGCWIIDEAQNFTRDELRTLLTRAGENTKVVVTGDVTQSDRGSGNGLLSVIQAFQGEKFYGHITLDKVHRGDVCRVAAERM